MRFWGLGFAALFPVCFKGYVFIHPIEVTECLLLTFESVNLYNFQQRISWLSHRWRTQRNAISNVNCRIQWIIESLNAPCALWYSEGHACLSVIKFSTLQACLRGLDVRVFAGFPSVGWSAPFKFISGILCGWSLGVIIIYAAWLWNKTCGDLLITVSSKRQAYLTIWPQIR